MNFLILSITTGSDKVATDRYINTLNSVYDGESRIIYVDESVFKKNKESWGLDRWKYVNEICKEYSDYIIMLTDVFDVIWQCDPRIYLKDIKNDIFYVSIEGMLNRYNSSMREWIRNSSKYNKIIELGYLDELTYCCGTVMAHSNLMKDLSEYILKNELDIYTDQSLMSCYFLEKNIKKKYILGLMESFVFPIKKFDIFNRNIYIDGKLVSCAHFNGESRKILKELGY